MTINLNNINKATFFLIIYLFFISFYLPILNFNDLYILKFLPNHEGVIYKIENQSIILGYIYVSINLVILIFFLNLIFKKFKKNIEIRINTKRNFFTNIILAFITSIFVFLKFNNNVNENLYHIFIQMLFFHSLVSIFISSEKKYFIYYSFICLSIIMFKTFVAYQIFLIYLFFISSLYFFYIFKIDIKKLIVYSIITIIILFSLNYVKVFLRGDIKDINFANRCAFVKIENIESCGKYSFNSFKFRNEIVPVPPSTFKLIYSYPETNFQYRIYTGINKGLERLLKMNYLASNIATMNNDFDNFKTEFIKGESYKLLITKFIPRILYPQKPVENWGQIYAKKFGYLPQYDNTTSINLDSVNESYINFGFYGALIYPLIISLFMIIVLLLVNLVINEFKLIILSSFPIFTISSLEGNASGWVGGFVSWIIIILLMNYLIKFIFLIKNLR